MKNFFIPVKTEKFKYVTLVWYPCIDSVAKMCKEHYDTKEYENTVIFVNSYADNDKLYLNQAYFEGFTKKIFYNLEHKYCYGLYPEGDADLIKWMHLMDINEVWTIEPGIELFEKEFPTKYMPMRYTNFYANKIQNDYKFDLGFVGVVGGASARRNKFFNDYVYNNDFDFTIKIINGMSITDAYEDLSNCKYMLDLVREAPQEYQNQVRLFEHICLGQTVLSEKCENDIFPGLIHKWTNMYDIKNLLATVEPEDFSDKYKAMTYRDDDYDNYRNEMIKTY